MKGIEACKEDKIGRTGNYCGGKNSRPKNVMSGERLKERERRQF